MSNLIAVAYPDQHRAAEVLHALHNLQDQDAIELEDAIIVTRDPRGALHIEQTRAHTAAKTVGGGTGGFLVGLFFLAPVVGAAVGAGAGLLAAKHGNQGIERDLARRLGEELQPGGSALLALGSNADRDRVLSMLQEMEARCCTQPWTRTRRNA